MNKQRIAMTVLIMGIGQVFTWVISLAYVVLISRYLGPSQFGALTLAKSIVVVFWLGAKLGMDTLMARSVARWPDRAGALVSAAVLARATLVLPVLAALYIYTHTAHLDDVTRQATYIFALGEIVWLVESLLLATFQGREHMSLVTIGSIAYTLLGCGFGAVMLWWRAGVVMFAACEVAAKVVFLLFSVHWMRRFGRLTWHVSRQDVRAVIVDSLAFWANDVFFTIYLYIDAVILAALTGSHAVGLYAPATRIFSVALFLTGIIGPATLPLLSRLGIDAMADFTRAGRKTVSLFIVCAVPLSVGLATFAQPLILTIFGPAYRLSVPVLVALSLCLVPTYLNFQFSQLLTASDRQWRWTAAMAVACMANPVFNVALIPFAIRTWHNGALGAALAWLLTEILMAVYGVIALRSVVLDRDIARVAVGALIGAAAQAAVVHLTFTLWSPLGEALGAGAYGVVVVVLAAVPGDDVALLWKTITRALH